MFFLSAVVWLILRNVTVLKSLLFCYTRYPADMDSEKEMMWIVGCVQLQATHETTSAAAHQANDNVVFRQ